MVYKGKKDTGLTYCKMNESVYIDHPRPGVGLLILMALFLSGFLAALPAVLLADARLPLRILISALLVIFAGILIYSFWLLHNVWYRIDGEGIEVKYGPAKVSYPWGEFKNARHKSGIFALKIGWLGVTPCVRLKNAVVLRKENSRIPLYLTPSAPRTFLEKIRQVAPQLVR